MPENIGHRSIEGKFLKPHTEDREGISIKEREAISALDAGLHRFGEFLLESREENTNISAHKEKELRKIRQRAGKALQVFFKGLRISTGIGAFALLVGGTEGFDAALDAYAGKNPPSLETDILHKHPVVAKIAEWYFGQNLVQVIDEYQRLAKLRV